MSSSVAVEAKQRPQRSSQNNNSHNPARDGGGQNRGQNRPHNSSSNSNSKVHHDGDLHQGSSSKGAGNSQADGNNHVNSKVLEPTQDQMRLANLMNDSSDLRDLHEKVQHVIDATGCEQDQAAIVLHDCEGDVNMAATRILEKDVEEDEWKLQTKKKDKKKNVAQAAEGQKARDGERGGHRDSENRRPQNGTERSTRGRGHDRGGRGGGSNGAPRLRGDGSKPRLPREERTESTNGNGNGNDGNEQYSRDGGASRGRGSSTRGRFSDRGRGRGGRERDAGAGRERPAGSFPPPPKDGRTFRRTQPTNSGSGNEAAESVDVFPNSIDTWTNEGTKPVATPTAPLAVGNWSDVVNNDDHWSEGEYEAGKMETRIFTSSKAGGVSEKGPQTITGVGQGQGQNHKDMASMMRSNNAKSNVVGKPTPTASGQPQTANRGVALLQSLQQQPTQTQTQQPPQSQPQQPQPVPVAPPAQLAQSFMNKSYINKQSAADSIKSLVGINSAGGYAAAAGQISNLDTRTVTSKTQRLTQKRSTKIPESAVEMPTNDNISALGVQFGALNVQFGADSNSTIFGLPSQDIAGYDNNHKSDSVKTQVGSALSDNLRPKMSNSPLRPSYGQDQNSSANQAAADLLKNVGHQGMGSSTSDRNAVTKNFGNKPLDAPAKTDMYSVASHQHQQQQPTASDLSYKSAYNSQVNQQYGSGPGNYAGAASTTAQGAYGQQSGYGSNQGYGGGQAYGSSYGQNMQQPNHNHNQTKNLTTLQDKLEAASSQVTGQLANSTATTNVLKNSLSSTGKGVQSLPQNVQQPLMGNPQYIMSSGGMPYAAFAPVYDPMAMQSGSRDPTAFTQYPTTTDVKYSRAESGNQDVSSTVSSASQAPVSQAHQPYMGHFPPGYGFFYTPMPPQGGMYQPGPGGVFPTMPAASNAHGNAASGFPKATGGYGSHSTYPSAYDPSGLQDSYKNYAHGSGQGQLPKGGQGIGQSTGDMMGGQQGYGKSQNQPQLKQNYEKMNYQSGVPSSFNPPGLGAGYTNNPYIQMPMGNPSLLPHNLHADAANQPGSIGSSGARGGQGPSAGGQSKPSYGGYAPNRW